MKIRIKGNSIRYRLTRSEVDALASKGFIEEKTELPDRTFIYAIERSPDASLSAAFSNGTVILKMPEMMIDEWISTEKVGFTGNSGAVNLLVEKDFVCIDNVDEDQSDNYANPSLKC